MFHVPIIDATVLKKRTEKRNQYGYKNLYGYLSASVIDYLSESSSKLILPYCIHVYTCRPDIGTFTCDVCACKCDI